MSKQTDQTTTHHQAPADEGVDTEDTNLSEEERAALAPEQGEAPKTEEPEATPEEEGAAEEEQEQEPEIEPGPAEIQAHRDDAIAQKFSGYDFDKGFQNLETKKAALKQRFDDGDIDQSEYLDEREKLLDDKQNLQKVRDIVADYEGRQQAQVERFNAAVEVFMAQEENAPFRDNPYLQQQLQQAMDFLVHSGEASGKSYGWLLNNAKRQMVKGHEMMTGQKQPQRQKPQDRKRDEAVARRDVPQTLSQVPTAEDHGDAGDKWAHVDRMSVPEMEQWMAENPREAEDYLKSAEAA